MCPDADTHPSQLGTRCHTGTRCDRRSRRSQRHGLRARHRWWLPRNTSLRKLGSVALPHTRRSHPHRGELWSACTLLTVLRKAGSIFFVVCASTTLQWNSMIRKQQPQVKVACAKGSANAYFSAWRSMCILICRSWRNCKEDVPAGLLFQCFAGDNRSNAALVAWLVFQHHMTASEGIRLFLQARPTLNPWQERPHILWALKTWEMRREETHHFVQSMVVEKMPRLAPDLIRSALGSGLKVTLPIQVSTRLNDLQRFQHSDGTPAPAEPRPKTVPRQAWEMAGQSYFCGTSAVSSLLVDYGLVLGSLSNLLHG